MKNLRDRLLQVRKQTGLSQAAFAARLGVSVPAIQKWERGDEDLSVNSQHLGRVCLEFKVDPCWLLLGETCKAVGAHGVSLTVIPRMAVVRREGADELVGLDNLNAIWAYNDEWAESRFRVQKADLACLVHSGGDSMAPMIQSGDILVLDRGSRDLVPGEFFLVDESGTIHVRGVRVPIPGKVELYSINPSYGAVLYERETLLDNVKVLARVVAFNRILI